MMLLENEIIFLNNCDCLELRAMCDELKKNSWNGADKKESLILHIINHYRMYEMAIDENILSQEVRCGCEARLKRIDEIIHQHMMLASIDEKKRHS